MTTSTEEKTTSDKEIKPVNGMAVSDSEKTQLLKIDYLENGIALITLDSASKVVVLGFEMMAELQAAIGKIKSRTNVRGVVITSATKDNFIAGADVNAIRELQNENMTAAYNASMEGKKLFSEIEAMTIPVIAAINGNCLGGGTELALACHYRVAANTKKTKIGLPEIQLGFVPGWGGCVRLPKLVGFANALSIILPGGKVDARKAWKMGLVDEVVDNPENLVNRAIEIAITKQPRRYKKPLKQALTDAFMNSSMGRNLVRDMALKGVKRSTKGNYPAPVRALDVAFKSFLLSPEKAYELEATEFAKLAHTDVSKYLVGLYFAREEARHMPEGVQPALELKTIGVLGAGVMGAVIANVAAAAGYDVVLKDIKQEFVDNGMKTVKSILDARVSKRKLSESDAQAILARVKGTTDYSEMKNCDLVIEAVPEVIAIKQAVLADLEKAISKPFIFATNTSTLSVTKIGEKARNPEYVVGIHFFNPVDKMPLIEIIESKHTAKEVTASAKQFALKLFEKVPVVCKDSEGFVVNRILSPYLLEAVKLLEEGVPYGDIEKAIKKFGLPMGPLELLDVVGLDVGGHAIKVMQGAFGDRLKPSPLLGKLLEERVNEKDPAKKWLGQKNGIGFYLWNRETGKKTGFNPEVLAMIEAKPNRKQEGEIQDRLILAMLNEAVRCLQEGVIEDPRQLDLALIFGIGFPPFRGGILQYADAIGVKNAYQKLEFLSKVAGENYEPAALLKKMADDAEPFVLATETAK